MSIEQALEKARCAEINLQNMVKLMPAMGSHPLLPMVEWQIKDCIEELERDAEKE